MPFGIRKLEPLLAEVAAVLDLRLLTHIRIFQYLREF